MRRGSSSSWALCPPRNPAQTHFSLHLNSVTGKSFPRNADKVRKISGFFSQRIDTLKAQAVWDHTWGSRCECRDCWGGRSAPNPKMRMWRTKHTPLLHNLFPKCGKSSLAPPWADGFKAESANFLISEQKQSLKCKIGVKWIHQGQFLLISSI